MIPAKFAKSGAAISDKIIVTSVVGLNVPANTKHVFRFKNDNFAHTCANVVDLESLMDNGDDLNNIFLVKKEDDKIEEHHQFSQIEKDDIYEMCRVNREGCKSDIKIYNQNQQKMTDALNEAELVWLTAERHFMETKQDSECWPGQGSDRTMPERLLKEREFKDVVVRMSLDQTDSRLYQIRTIGNLGHLENKIDHVITMTEGEVRRGLRKQKLEYERQQQHEKKPIKVKRSRYLKNQY